MELILKDKTTNSNIIWATDAYRDYGESFQKNKEIHIEYLLNYRILKSRFHKEDSIQSDRTKEHAEVFTPSWIVKKMNDYTDEEWFGYPKVFDCNLIKFPINKTWKDYIF